MADNESAMSTYEYSTKYHDFCDGFIFGQGGFIFVLGWLIVFDEYTITHKWVRLQIRRIRQKNYDFGPYFVANSYFRVAYSLRHMVDSFFNVSDLLHFLANSFFTPCPPCRIYESAILKNEFGRNLVSHSYKHMVHSINFMADSFFLQADSTVSTCSPCPLHESVRKKYEFATKNLNPAHNFWRIHIFWCRIHYEIRWIH